MSKLPPNLEKPSPNVEPGDKGFESLKWIEFCNRVNNQGDDPYKVMNEMGLDKIFFNDLPSAEGVSPTSDVIGMPFVEAVDDRGNSPTATLFSSSPPTLLGEPVRVTPARRTGELSFTRSESAPSIQGRYGESIEEDEENYTWRDREEDDLLENDITFEERRRRVDSSPTANLFNRTVGNNPTTPGQDYDETTFHNITGLWFPGSANESRTRDARRMDMEVDFNSPLIDNPFAGENDIYLTGRSLTQYEDWRDNEVQQGNIDMDTETITINNIPGGRRTLRPFVGYGPFNPIRGEGFVEMPDSFWRWYGIRQHNDENYYFNRFNRSNRTTGGYRKKKNKKLSKKRKKSSVKSKKKSKRRKK